MLAYKRFKWRLQTRAVDIFVDSDLDVTNAADAVTVSRPSPVNEAQTDFTEMVAAEVGTKCAEIYDDTG